MDRPFITKDDVLEYSAYDLIQEATEKAVENAISRAEMWIMRYCKRDFADLDEGSLDADTLILADKMLSEAFLVNSQLRAITVNTSENGLTITQEVNPNYTFHYSTASEKTIDINSVTSEIALLLEPLVLSDTGNTVMRIIAV